MFAPPFRYKAGLAILLIVSTANLGIAARFLVSGSTGQLLFVLTRVGMLLLPLGWFVYVDGGKPAVSAPSKHQYLVGIILGAAMFGVILTAYWLVGRYWINPNDVRIKAEQIALNKPIVYLLSASYFTLVNSLIEEYIWRWFICRQCEAIFSKIGAIGFASLCFTLHHVILLAIYTNNSLVVSIGSLGVFIAGVVWSWCYLTYRSLWACYISHVLADLAIAFIGWHLLFIAERAVS